MKRGCGLIAVHTDRDVLNDRRERTATQAGIIGIALNQRDHHRRPRRHGSVNDRLVARIAAGRRDEPRRHSEVDRLALALERQPRRIAARIGDDERLASPILMEPAHREDDVLAAQWTLARSARFTARVKASVIEAGRSIDCDIDRCVGGRSEGPSFAAALVARCCPCKEQHRDERGVRAPRSGATETES
jgi:hypothetical protein